MNSSVSETWRDWLIEWLRIVSTFFLHPIYLLKNYERAWLSADLMAGLTVAFVMLPQSIAFALIADLPPQTGLYAAIIASIVGALWGSSSHLHSGPTNTTSLLVLSTLATADLGDASYVGAAALIAVMVGVIRLALGLARLGALLNFVSDSVIIGFSSGAAILIVVNQLRHLLGLEIASDPLFLRTIVTIFQNISQSNGYTVGLGILTIAVSFLLKRFAPKLPGTLITLILSALLVGVLQLDQQGVSVLPEVTEPLPVFALPALSYDLIQQLSVGAFAIALVGLMEAVSISQTIASTSGQRLDSDQEFVGQGLANILVGFFSGYPTSGSFTRSAINYDAGAKSGLSALFSGVFMVILLLLFARFSVYLSRTALAAIIILAGVRLINRKEIVRIWRGSRSDALVMVTTLLSTLFLPLEFAILTGIIVSFVMFVNRTSHPTVMSVLPDDQFVHLRVRSDRPECPQMAVITIAGALYFGATSHVEDQIRQRLVDFPEQKFLLMRMHRVHYLDISAINMLKTIVTLYRNNGGDVYMTAFRPNTRARLSASGFFDWIGRDHILPRQQAITILYAKVVNPIHCIYQCPHRVWEECLDIPKNRLDENSRKRTMYPPVDFLAPISDDVPTLDPLLLERLLRQGKKLLLIDVRSMREWNNEGFIQGSQKIPMFRFIEQDVTLPPTHLLVLISRGGRRSHHLTHYLQIRGNSKVCHLDGGLLNWKASGLPILYLE